MSYYGTPEVTVLGNAATLIQGSKPPIHPETDVTEQALDAELTD
jgi:hypothetical protein